MTTTKEVRLISKLAIGATYLLMLGGAATTFVGAAAEAGHSIETADTGYTTEQLQHQLALDEDVMIGSGIIAAITLLTLPGVADSLSKTNKRQGR